MQESFEAKRELIKFMHEQVAERKADINARGSDRPVTEESNVFSMLVRASEEEEGKFKLDDSELVCRLCSVYLTLLRLFRLEMFISCFLRDMVSCSPRAKYACL